MKNQKEKTQKSEKLWKLIKFSIFCFSVLLILGLIYSFVSSQITLLKKLEFSDDYSNEFLVSDRESSYTTDRPYTFLLFVEYNGNQKEQIDGFVVIQVNPNSKTASVISINPDTYLYSTVFNIDPEETDLVRIKDLFVVGELETPQKTCSYAVYSIEELLAIHIDGYMWVTSENLEEFIMMGGKTVPEEFFEEEMDYEDWSSRWNDYWIDFFDSVSLWKVWRNRAVISNIRSNMDVVSAYSFIRDFGSIKSDQINSVILTQEQLLKQTNNKGDIVDVITQSELDKALNGYLEDNLVDREQARVELFNGSQVNGLGARYQRWLEHLGVDVIRVQNAPGRWEQTTIYVTNLEDFSYTLDKIINLWGDDVKVVEKRPDFITTGDIIIVLGLDFLEH